MIRISRRTRSGVVGSCLHRRKNPTAKILHLHMRITSSSSFFLLPCRFIPIRLTPPLLSRYRFVNNPHYQTQQVAKMSEITHPTIKGQSVVGLLSFPSSLRLLTLLPSHASMQDISPFSVKLTPIPHPAVSPKLSTAFFP